MATTYTWKEVKCWAYPSINDHTKVINLVEGICVATDDNGGSAEEKIAVGIPWHTLENFIDFNDVTKDQAVQWLENALSTENLNAFKNRLATNASIHVRKTFED